MKRVSFLSLLFVLFVSFLYSETVMVKTVSGDVKVKTGNSWVVVKPLAKIDDSSLLKVYEKSKVQIMNSAGTIVSVDTPREVVIKDLFIATSNPRMFAKLNSIKNKIGKKGSAGEEGPTAVAGVRGADVYAQNKDALRKDLYWEE